MLAEKTKQNTEEQKIGHLEAVEETLEAPLRRAGSSAKARLRLRDYRGHVEQDERGHEGVEELAGFRDASREAVAHPHRLFRFSGRLLLKRAPGMHSSMQHPVHREFGGRG